MQSEGENPRNMQVETSSQFSVLAFPVKLRKLQYSTRKNSKISNFRRIASFSEINRKMISCKNTCKLPGDLFLFNSVPKNDKNQAFGLMTIFNNYKEIVKVVHDENLNIIQAQVRNLRNAEESFSKENLCENLRNSGDLDALRLFNILTKYIEFVKENRTDFLSLSPEYLENNIKNQESYLLFQQRNEELIRKHSNSPAIIYKFQTNLQNGSLEINEIGFNSLLGRIIADAPFKFIQSLLKKGFPDCLQTENYYKYMSILIEKAFLRENKDSQEILCYLNGEEYPQFPAKLNVETSSFKKDDYSEHFVILYFDIDSHFLEIARNKRKEKQIIKKKLKNIVKAPKISMNEKNRFAQDSIHFLTKFYPQIIVNKNLGFERVCTFKELL